MAHFCVGLHLHVRGLCVAYRSPCTVVGFATSTPLWTPIKYTYSPAGIPFGGFPYTFIPYPRTDPCNAFNIKPCSPSMDPYGDYVEDCIHMLLRARVIVFSVAHAHISSMRLYYLKKGQTPSLGSSDASIGALIARVAAVCIGNWVVGELMLYGDLTGGSDRWASGDASLFGIMNTWNVDLIDGSELTDCLFQLGRNVSCVNKNLHSPKETGLTETNGKWANGTAYVPWGTTINTPPWNATNRGY